MWLPFTPREAAAMIMSSLRLGEQIPWIRWIARLSAGDALYLQRCGARLRGAALGDSGGGEVAELEKLRKFLKKSHQNLKAVLFVWNCLLGA
jgi:hypothetical protein